MSEKIRYRVRWGRADYGDTKSKKHLLGYFTMDEIKKLESMLNISNYYMDVRLQYPDKKFRSWIARRRTKR